MSVFSNLKTAYENYNAGKRRIADFKEHIAAFEINGVHCEIIKVCTEKFTVIRGSCDREPLFAASYDYDQAHQLGKCIEHLVEQALVLGEFKK